MAQSREVPRVHVFGASGSGTTTLSRALAARLDVGHFDADDYFWVPIEPPFTQKYPAEKRVELLAFRTTQSGAARLVDRESVVPVMRLEYDAPTDAWADAVLERLASA